jgi:Family of unknown function (DUF6527)
MGDKLHYMGDSNVGKRGGGKLYVFHCPGCHYAHPIEVGGLDGWTWNGSLVAPTVTPSLLCNIDHPEARCHSFVTDGMIHFLGDCFHKLAGQTVEIPNWEDE